MIATREEVKNILNITGAESDAIIDILIPVMQSTIVSICNNDFVAAPYFSKGKLSLTESNAGTKGTIIGANFGAFSDGDDIVVYKTIRNDGHFTIDTLTPTVITLNLLFMTRNELAEKQLEMPIISLVYFPPGLQIPFAGAINYGINQLKMQGLSTVKIGDYAASIQFRNTALPTNVMDQLRPYMRPKVI